MAGATDVDIPEVDSGGGQNQRHPNLAFRFVSALEWPINDTELELTVAILHPGKDG